MTQPVGAESQQVGCRSRDQGKHFMRSIDPPNPVQTALGFSLALTPRRRVFAAEEPRKSSLFGSSYILGSVRVQDTSSTWPGRPAGKDRPASGRDDERCLSTLRDQVWTLEPCPVPVQVYSPDGSLVRAWGQGLFGKPHHLRIDDKNNIWIADTGKHVIQKLTPPLGEVLLTLGTPNQSGARRESFQLADGHCGHIRWPDFCHRWLWQQSSRSF